MKTSIALLALLALSVVSSAQDLSKKIEYKTVAKPLHLALADISKQAGVGLYAEGSMAGEPVVLRLHDVTVLDTMSRVATAMNAEWRKAPDGFELWRSPDLTAKIRSEALRLRTERLKKSLDEMVKRSRADQPWTDADAQKLAFQFAQMQKKMEDPESASSSYEEYSILNRSGPEERALWRLLSGLDLRTLAALPEGERMVLSNQPTDMQQRMDEPPSGFGEQMQQEHNLYSAAMKKQAAANKKPGEDEDSSDDEADMKAVPTRFMLTVERADYEAGLSLQLYAFDAENHVLARSRANLTGDGFMQIEADRAKVVKQTEKEPEIQVSPLTAELLKFIRAMSSQASTTPPSFSPEVKQALLHPETLDPLATAASEAMLGVAEIRNENLAFYPDDSMFMVALFAGQEGKLKPSLVMQALQGLDDISPYQVKEEAGWLVAGPSDPFSTAGSRTDREAFGKYLRAMAENGFAPLAEMAELATTVHGSSFPMLVMMYSMLVDPSSMMAVGETDLKALKVYASLAPEQLQRLEAKQAISFAELTRAQLAAVYRYIYGQDHVTFGPTGPKNEAMARRSYEAVTDPTEALPDGLPANAALSLGIDNEKTYLVKMAFNAFEFTMPMDINALTGLVAGNDGFMGSGPDGGETKTKVVSISPGMDRSLHLRFAVGQKKTVEAVIKQTLRIPGGPWTKETLPEDLKKQIAALKLQMQQAQMETGEDNEGEAEPPTKVNPPGRR